MKQGFYHEINQNKLEFEDVGFCGGGKTGEHRENPRSKARTTNKLNSHMAPGRNRTRAILVGGESSHHCVILAPNIYVFS